MSYEFNELIAEEIFKKASLKVHTDSNLAIRRQINKIYREQDSSSLWPINNRFNLTERAIKNARQLESKNNNIMSPYEYCYFIENKIQEITDSEITELG